MFTPVPFGTCLKCKQPLTMFPYAFEGVLDVVCRCTEGTDLVEFDENVQEMQAEMAATLMDKPLSELACMLSADVGSLQTAMLNSDKKSTLAFLIRVAAMTRHLAAEKL